MKKFGALYLRTSTAKKKKEKEKLEELMKVETLLNTQRDFSVTPTSG